MLTDKLGKSIHNNSYGELMYKLTSCVSDKSFSECILRTLSEYCGVDMPEIKIFNSKKLLGKAGHFMIMNHDTNTVTKKKIVYLQKISPVATVIHEFVHLLGYNGHGADFFYKCEKLAPVVMELL